MASYMGYGGYSPLGAPFGYNPQYYPMQQVQQPIQQQNQTQPKSFVQSIQFVTEDEAKAYIVMPNTSVMLMDAPNNVFWIKSADALGQSTFEKYRFEKYSDVAVEKEKPKEFDYSNFATKEDLTGMIKKDDLKSILNQLDRMEKKISINNFLAEEKVNSGVKNGN